MSTTTGTKYAVRRSAMRSIGARLDCPSRTTAIIESSMEAPAGPVTLIVTADPLLIVPE